MARTFSGTTDQLRFPIINQMTGVYSIGAWVRRNSDTTFDTIYSRCTSASQAKIALQITTSGKIALEEIGVGEIETSTLTVKAADGWCFVGVHKPAAEAARAHVWKQASGWTHQNMSATLGNAVTAGAGGTVRIGEWQGGSNDNFDGDIEVVVEYNVLISNEGFESLAFSRSGMLSRRPTGLWELRQASVEQKVPDLSGTGMNESVRTGTSVATRSCPFYFVGGPPLRSVQTGAGGGSALTLELSDSAAFSESRGAGGGKAAADALALTESMMRSAGLGRADAMAIADAISRAPGIGVGEQQVLADTLARAFGLSPADALTAADALVRRAELAPKEVLDMEDLLATAWSARRQLVEQLTAADVRAAAAVKSLLENADFADATRIAGARAEREDLGLLDLLELTLQRIAEDALGLSESSVRSLGLGLSDTLALLDQLEGTGTAGAALEEVLQLGEGHQLAVGRTTTDSAVLGDAAAKSTARGGTDAVLISDARGAAVGRIQADGVSLAESIAKSSTRVQTDAIGFSESIGKGVSAKVADGLAVVEGLARQALKFVADLLGLSDAGEATEPPAYLVLIDAPATALAVVDRATTALALIDQPATDLVLLHQPTTYLTLEDEPHV